MQTRRDQFQAYKYLVQRVLASMIGNDPESPEQPMRRVSSASAISVVVGALACGAVGVYGWLVGSTSDAWLKEYDVVIREKGTAAQFVYLLNDKTQKGELHEVPNFASAQLILGNPEPPVVDRTRGSLQQAQRGGKLGIPGAPTILPGVEDLASIPWAVCSREAKPSDETKASHQVDMVIGKKNIGADDLGERGLIVQSTVDGERQLYLVWNGERMQAPKQTLDALGIQVQPVTVGSTWLNAVPEGRRVAGLSVSGRGQNADYTVNGQVVALGQVFQVRGEESYWMAFPEGTRPITRFQAKLLLATSAVVTGGARQTVPTPADAGELARLNKGFNVQTGNLPAEMPEFAEPEQPATPTTATVCAWYDGKNEVPRITLNGTVPEASAASAQARAGLPTGAAYVDHTIVQPGKGAVVAVAPKQGKDPAGYYVVTDDGRKYAMSTDALGSLGYTAENLHIPTLPAHLLKLVPSGPALSPEAARQGWTGRADTVTTGSSGAGTAAGGAGN